MQQKSSRAPLIIVGLLGLAGMGGVAALFMTGLIGSGGEVTVRSAKSDLPEPGAPPPPAQSALAAAPSILPPNAGGKSGAGAPQRKPVAPSSAAPQAPPSAVPQAPATPPPPSPPASPLKVGERCSANSWCQSGFCVDGFCCDMACNAKCMACSGAKKGASGNGICGWISGGTDPDNECGEGKRCNGNGSCVTLTPEQIKNLTGE